MAECSACGKPILAGIDGVVPDPANPNGPWIHEACAKAGEMAPEPERVPEPAPPPLPEPVPEEPDAPPA